MSDDGKPIDFKKAKMVLKNKKLDKNQKQENNNIRHINRPPASKKPNGKLFNNLDEFRKQKEVKIKDKLKEIEMIKKRLESEEYIYRVLQIAQEVFVNSQPHLLSNEQERMAAAEKSIQAGQTFYKMAKNFMEYVAVEDLINDIMKDKNKNDP